MTTHHGNTIGTLNDLTVLNCLTCGFAHLDPIPNNAAYYASGFFEQDKAHWLRESQEDAAWLRIQHEIELTLIKACCCTSGRALLDVGAGFGDFMRYALNNGWDTVGLEYSNYACQVLYDKELAFQQGTIETAYLHHESADVVRLAWVLEHLADPYAAIKKCFETLKPGGVLAVTVPNDFSEMQNVVKAQNGKGEYWLHRSHINYFTNDTLTALLRRAGFGIVSAYNTFPMELFALTDEYDYIGKADVGRAAHRLRKQIETAIHAHDSALLIKLWTALGAVGIGRDMVRIAVKPFWNWAQMLNSKATLFA